jgi:hypothetical protein
MKDQVHSLIRTLGRGVLLHSQNQGKRKNPNCIEKSNLRKNKLMSPLYRLSSSKNSTTIA